MQFMYDGPDEMRQIVANFYNQGVELLPRFVKVLSFIIHKVYFNVFQSV